MTTFPSGVATPLLSVVIPTWNGIATLPALFDALDATEHLQMEVIAVDSGSTDGTIELARKRATRLLQIEPAAFDHGLARNQGIAASSGDFVVCLVQDALPASPGWLRSLVAPLLAHESIAGTWARQVPAAAASALIRFYMNQASVSSEEHVVRRVSATELESLAPLARMERCRFDNVCSCIRKSVWQEIPFRAVPIAEDLAWAREVLCAGHALAYCPQSVVIHSHDRPALYEYRRTRMLHRQLADLFGVQTVPSSGALLRSITSCVKLHWTVGRADAPARALALAVAWPLGQYLGARDHQAGRPHYRPRGI